MADATPSVSDSASPENKSTTAIRQEMQETRESITEKVAALENQVIGTIQNAADTVTNTVDAVKEAVTSTPAAVSESVKQSVHAVKQSFHETIGSISVGGCVRNNPWASLGVSVFAGFFFAYRSGRRSESTNYASRHIASAPAAPAASAPVAAPAAEQPHGLLIDLSDMLGKELRQLAEGSLVGVIQSLKQSLGTHIPEVVDTAVNRVSDHLQNASMGRAKASVNGC